MSRVVLVRRPFLSIAGGRRLRTISPPSTPHRVRPLAGSDNGQARRQFQPAALKQLSRALALVIGTEAMIVCKDVLRLDDAESRKVRGWAIRALVDAARK